MARHLIVANQTAASEELTARLVELAEERPGAEFVLLVPATATADLLVWEEGQAEVAARRRGEAASAHLQRAGLRVVGIRVGDADPRMAVDDELRASPDYETIIVATFPAGISRWIGLDLPARIRRVAPDSEVIHVVSPAKAASRS